MLNARFARFFNAMLQHWTIHDRQHLLRHNLGGGKDAGAKARHRENGFADTLRHGASILKRPSWPTSGLARN
jgi:hypothetical protein